MDRSRTVLACVLVLEAITCLPTAAMPVFLGHYVDAFGFEVGVAGRIASAETFGMAIGQAVAAVWAARAGVELRRIAAACLVAFAIAQLASIWHGSALELSAARFVSGMAGPGLLFAVLGIYLASTANPDRAYSLYYGVAFVVGPIGLYLLPALLTHSGAAPVYAALSSLAMASMLLLIVLPPRNVDRRDSAIPAVPRAASHRLVAALLIGSLFVNYIGNGGVWVYMERIAESHGVEQATRSSYLAIGMATGLLGTALAFALAARMARIAAITVGNVALLVSYALLLWGASGAGFLTANILLNVAVTLATPFYLSALARLDPSGSTVGWGVLAFGLGYGLSPGAISVLVGDGHFDAALEFAIITALGALLLALAAWLYERGRSDAIREPVLA